MDIHLSKFVNAYHFEILRHLFQIMFFPNHILIQDFILVVSFFVKYFQFYKMPCLLAHFLSFRKYFYPFLHGHGQLLIK